MRLGIPFYIYSISGLGGSMQFVNQKVKIVVPYTVKASIFILE
jgi:hypothetical protein